MRNLETQFFQQGWCRFPRDPLVEDWVSGALAAARATLDDPEQAQWHRCQGTWFAGVNALPNREDSSLDGQEPLQGEVIDFIRSQLALDGFAWDRGQVSVCFPGYPKATPGESPGRSRFRREQDAAHVDGLLPEGEQRRRHFREGHGFVLGLPMVDFAADAAPFVAWEKSHELIRVALRQRFRGIEASLWGEEDITEAYHAARDRVFETCRRVEIHARPGEAFLVHRLMLHGTAPWRDGAEAGADGRMICFFRPDVLSAEEWLNSP